MPAKTAALLPHPVRGRPRSQRARRAVLEAARTLVEKGGYPATTIEAIAAESKVAKTTIYRWWPNRAS
ncbi:MAG: TetR/AcrR family transcriptional regulator, partial [Gaiellaceae bacterium]